MGTSLAKAMFQRRRRLQTAALQVGILKREHESITHVYTEHPNGAC
ncbi:MAG TPA: hypothetical protein VF207_04330 [Chthoniobacterales bacterium]